MQTNAATNNLTFIVSLTSNLNSSLHQRDSFCAGLLSFGDAAIAQRQGARLAEIGNILSSLPLPQSIRAIGDYYTGIATGNRAQIEQASHYAPPKYRARAILALGAQAAFSFEREQEIKLYFEAIREARQSQDVYTAIHASKMPAIRRAIDGQHNRAIDDLEALFPLARLIARQDPATFFDLLNSFAVELCEVGKTEEASRAMKIVLASSLVAVNPEWQETAALVEQQQAQPLIIAVPELRRRSKCHRETLIFYSPRIKKPRASSEFPQIAFRITTNQTRAGPLGPRAPPVFIL